MALSRVSSQIFFKQSFRSSCATAYQKHATFMSDSFDLKEEWNKRLQAEVFKKIDMNQYFVDIDRQFNQSGVASHVDIDVFANGLLLSEDQGVISSDHDIETRFEQLEELITRFISTPEAVKMLESTPQAVVRASVDANQTDTLLRFLNHPLQFGLIADDYTHIYLLNHFLKAENYRDAAKVGILLMLQEDYIPIGKEMALYGTYKYLKNLKNNPDEPWEPQPMPVEPEPEDEIKIRVREVPNQYFDDHFDLVKKEHLLGKTLFKMAKVGLQNRGANDTLRNSLCLLGSVYFEKWSQVQTICENSKNNHPMAEEIVQECINYLSILGASENNNEIETLLKSLKSTDLDIENELKALVEQSIQSDDFAEKNYVENQIKTFQKWNEIRESELSNHFTKIQQQGKIQEIEQQKIHLDEEEQKLFYFKKYAEMEKDKLLRWRKWKGTWPKRQPRYFRQIKMGLPPMGGTTYTGPSRLLKRQAKKEAAAAGKK